MKNHESNSAVSSKKGLNLHLHPRWGDISSVLFFQNWFSMFFLTVLDVKTQHHGKEEFLQERRGLPRVFQLFHQKFFQDSSSSPGTGKWIFSNRSLDTFFFFQPDFFVGSEKRTDAFLGPETNHLWVFLKVSPFETTTSRVLLFFWKFRFLWFKQFQLVDAMTWCLSLPFY